MDHWVDKSKSSGTWQIQTADLLVYSRTRQPPEPDGHPKSEDQLYPGSSTGGSSSYWGGGGSSAKTAPPRVGHPQGAQQTGGVYKIAGRDGNHTGADHSDEDEPSRMQRTMRMFAFPLRL